MPKLNVQQNNQNVIQAFRNALAIGNLKGIIASDGSHNFSTAGSNRNLLDNPWFWSGAVNQRSATGATYGAFGYDRWKGVSTGYTINSDGSISVMGTAVQVLPERGIADEEYTVSVKYVDGTIESGTAIYTSNKTFTFSGGNITVYPSANQMNIAATSKNIRAVKLELGSVSTLANDAPPDYGTELLKCARYFFRAKGEPIGMGYIGSALSSVYISVPTPVPMRAVPSVSFGGTLFARVQGATINITSITATSPLFTGSAIGINGVLASSAPAIGTCAMYGNASAYIDFSADL